MLESWTSQDVGFQFGRTNAIIYAGYLYQFGAEAELAANDAANTISTISSSRINSDGSLEMAKVVGSMPTVNLRSFRGCLTGDTLYCLGGGIDTGAAVATIFSFRLARDGGIGSLKALAPLTSALASSTVGYDIPHVGDVYYTLNAVGNIAAFKLTPDGPLPAGFVQIGVNPTSPPTLTSGTRLLVYRNNLIIVGGFTIGGAGVPVSAVWAAKVNGFSIGPMRRVGDLPLNIRETSAIIVDNKLVVVGGYAGTVSADSVQRSEVYVASLDQEANCGPFLQVGGLPTATACAAIVATKTHVYVVGGGVPTGGTGSRLNVVQYARIK